MVPGFEAVIGLEVHVQLLTRTKMFCGCANTYGGVPNSRTCPVCLGFPGALPVLNREAVRMALLLGLALEARVQPRSTFYRKQYVYPDLPKGYQITQGPVALVEEGALRIPGDPSVRGGEGPVRAGILRVHLEEDAGKSVHDPEKGESRVDLNRAGVPLLEIVGQPDLRSAQEASDYLKAIHRLVTFLGICDGNLEEGSFRCDANVSLHRPGEPLGTRVEVKNLNSFRFVRQALDFEIARQGELLLRGEAFPQETRGWDSEHGETRSQRGKEADQDYRYFPEPDLPALTVDLREIAQARATMPELPEDRALRFQTQFGLSDYEAGTLLQTPVFGAFFERVAEACGNGKAAANWLLGEVSRTLNDRGVDIGALGLAADDLGDLVRLVEDGTVNLKTAKEVLYPAILAHEGRPRDLVVSRGLGKVADRGVIEALVREVLAANAPQVAAYRGGKLALRGFFVGQVMKAGKGRVDAGIVNEVLDAELAGEAHGG